MSSRIVVITIEMDSDRWAEVECEVWPEVPMRRSGHPDTWEPAEPGEVAVLSVTLHHAEHDSQQWLTGPDADEWCIGREEAIEDAAIDAFGDLYYDE